MANPKLTIEFMPSGASVVKFSAITGITPGKLDRSNLQARKELKRLCGVAGVEAQRKKAEKAKQEETGKAKTVVAEEESA